jgi:hypothetical protein
MSRDKRSAMHPSLPLDTSMKHQHLTTALACAALFVLPASMAMAGEGHDHGDSAPAASSTALPRFAAVSEAFELVGVLSGKQLTLYLDRYDDNAPVPDAQIELEIAGLKFKAEKHGEAVYEVVLKEEPKEGVLAITATVMAGKETDLLAGELDIHPAAHAPAATPARSWQRWAGWAAGGALALLMLAWAAKRVAASRRTRITHSGVAA